MLSSRRLRPRATCNGENDPHDDKDTHMTTGHLRIGQGCLLAAFALALALAACGGGVGFYGEVVGGSCSANRDCEERCLTGGDFPQGTCTVSCSSDSDCPSGTYCIRKEGGVCLLGCRDPSDCRDRYSCKAERNEGHGGDSLVCIH